jgi:hypothetical protein
LVVLATGIIAVSFLLVVICQLDDRADRGLLEDEVDESCEVPGLGVEVGLEQQPDAVEVVWLGVEEGEVRLHRLELQQLQSEECCSDSFPRCSWTRNELFSVLTSSEDSSSSSLLLLLKLSSSLSLLTLRSRLVRLDGGRVMSSGEERDAFVRAATTGSGLEEAEAAMAE